MQRNAELMLTAKLLEDEESPSPDEGLNSNSDQEFWQLKCLDTTRTCSAAIGFCIGVYMQCSSNALNFLLGFSDSERRHLSFEKYMALAMSWSVVSSLLGVGVLLLIRSCIIATFYATNQDRADDSLSEKEIFMTRVMACMQQAYTLGALAGLGAAWASADYLLGCSRHMHKSLFTCIGSIVCFFLTPKY